jgi:hypothetical protein
MSDTRDDAGRWVPDNPDGSGWAEVDWASTIRGSRYYYRHGQPGAEASQSRPAWYRVVTRLDTPHLHAPHENSYFVAAQALADFLAELTLAGGDEQIWHIEPCTAPPPEANVGDGSVGGRLEPK